MSDRLVLRRTPAWAVVCLAVGVVVVVLASAVLVAAQWAIVRYEGAIEQRDLFGRLNPGEAYGRDIEGPLNILLVGLDTRPSRPHEPPRADAVVILHVTEGLDRGYLISLPRDTLVDIPPYPQTGYPGGRDRLNSAMHYGSRQVEGEELPDVGRGFELLARTIADLTGIAYFDAGVIINFEGFTKIVDAMGGVTMEIDERIVSKHRQPDGRHRPLNQWQTDYVGEQMVYEPGVWHLEGWQALDIARQRYGLDGGDYSRQHNQQLLLRAMAERAISREIVTDPVALDGVLRAAGESLTFDGRGRRVVDFAFALRDIRPEAMQMVALPASNVGVGFGYRGEQLDAEAYQLFVAIQEGRIDEFMLRHPDFLRQP